MDLTPFQIHLSAGIRCVIQDKPATIVIQCPAPMTIEQLCREIGIPAVLVAFAVVDGVKKNMDDLINADAAIHLFGTMAGG